ncbi:MAG: glycine dehydrogenase, partial [Frankiales bacterium]|nr:glycine dehydrogenase [Frankiales bacterium]
MPSERPGHMATSLSLAALESAAPFATRHIGPSEDEVAKMLAVIGHGSLEDLAKTAVPDAIRATEQLRLPAAATEQEAIAELRALAARNTVQVPMLGLGYHGTHTPPVVLRNVLENPAWYTAYTPYQPEISQGRLEALLNFQTLIGDLTGLPTSNASLLDEGTAAAEAMTLCRRQTKAPAAAVFAVDQDCHPQTIAVVKTRALPLGIEVRIVDLSTSLPSDIFGLLVQYPGTTGQVRDLKPLAQHAHASGALLVVAADLLALTLLESPGDAGADVAVGTSQRFGVPLGYGGPHAGYMAVRSGLERAIPGRLVGVSVDADGHRAYRLALQTREQHIRREKATSNICTAQVLLAVIAGMYAVWHGPEGLSTIAQRTHRYATLLATALGVTGAFFDTITVDRPDAAEIVERARVAGVDLRLTGTMIGISTDETTTRAHLDVVVDAFGRPKQDWDALDSSTPDALPAALRRTSPFLTHEVFSSHHSETALLRYLRRLADKDLALDRSMIPLGSCTMKLNATTEMEPITWPEFGALHPFTPTEHARGYRQLVTDLEGWLCEITGYDAVSLQPNAGSQGEFAGLLAIRGYHRSRGDEQRDVCLIPSSAHGTNAASAVMAGMRVAVVACDDSGNVDLADLDRKIAMHREDLAAIMVTYPSTHGVYEASIADLCAKVHDAGGQVYVDGANLNAL